MCKTCNGTGGLAIDNGWYINFAPCPAINCDFKCDDSDVDRLKAMVGYNQIEAMTA